MRVTCLILLALVSVVVVTDCKPLSEDNETAPCVGCEQKIVRKKRCLCLEMLIEAIFGIQVRPRRYQPRYVYVGNGHHNTNHVVLGKVHDAYIGNGHHNNNDVFIDEAHRVYIGNGEYNKNRVMINKADEIHVGNGRHNYNQVKVNRQW